MTSSVISGQAAGAGGRRSTSSRQPGGPQAGNPLGEATVANFPSSGGSAAAQGADPSGSSRMGRAGCYADYVRERNQERARSDPWMVGLIMAILSWAAFKHRHTIPARDLGAHVATLAASMLGMLWLRLDVASYVRWRELFAAALRLAVAGSPLAKPMMRTIAERLGSGALGILTPLAFFPGLVFASHSLRLALPGLGLPLRAAAHVAVQAAQLALVWAQGEGVCRALVSSGPEAEVLVASWHSTFAWLEAMLPLPLPLPQPLPALRGTLLGQCRCLVGFVQAALGFLLPVGLVLASEGRAYAAYRRRCEGGGGSSSNSGANASGEASSRAAAAAGGPPWWQGGRALEALLLSAWWGGGVGADLRLFALLALLGATWTVVAAMVGGCG